MSKIEYFMSGTGCGSGTSRAYEIKIDGIQVFQGTQQFPCGTTEEQIKATIIGFRPYGTGDTAYYNGVQISGGTGTAGNLIIAAAVVVLGYMLMRKA